MPGKCRGCSSKVPNEALKCPHCGYPYPTHMVYSPMILIGWGINRLIVILQHCSIGTPKNRERNSEEGNTCRLYSFLCTAWLISPLTFEYSSANLMKNHPGQGLKCKDLLETPHQLIVENNIQRGFNGKLADLRLNDACVEEWVILI